MKVTIKQEGGPGEKVVVVRKYKPRGCKTGGGMTLFETSDKDGEGRNRAVAYIDKNGHEEA